MIYDVKSFGQITEDCQGIFWMLFVVSFGTVIYEMHDNDNDNEFIFQFTLYTYTTKYNI